MPWRSELGHNTPQAGRLGSPRIHDSLKKAGVPCSQNRVTRITPPRNVYGHCQLDSVAAQLNKLLPCLSSGDLLTIPSMRQHSLILSLLGCTSILLASPSAMAAPTAQRGSIADVRVTLQEGKTNALNLVVPKSWTKDAVVFGVPDPGRIVIDFPNGKAAKNAELSFKGSNSLKGLRLGRHADKVRIVVDLPEGLEPRFESSWKGSALTITLGRGELIAAPPPADQPQEAPPAPVTELQARRVAEPPTQKPTPQATPATPAPTPKVTAQPTRAATPTGTPWPTATPTTAPTPKTTPTARPSPSPSAPQKQTPSPTATPSATPTEQPTPATPAPTPEPSARATEAPTPPVAAVSTVQSNASRVLSGIQFDYAEAARLPLVKIKLSFRSEYKLTRRDQKTFDLEIPNCGISTDALALPYFPPHDFVGFTFVKVERSGNGVKVALGVDRGVRIASVVNENEIWIKALNS